MSIDLRDYLTAPAEQTWNLPIEHWSPSSLAMLQRCPYQWQQRYIHHRRERPGEAPVTGTAVHAALEVNFRQKITSQTDLPIVALLDQYAEEIFPLVVLNEQEKSGEEVVWDDGPDKARARGKVMVSEYQGQVAHRIQPEEVELKLQVDFGLPVPVEGRFDVDRANSVIDIKTGKTATRKPKEAWRIQAAVYGRARAKPVEFHSVAASAKTHKASVLTPLEEEALLVHPTIAERVEIARSIGTLSALACFYMARHGVDQPWPTLGRFHTWACDYCGFRSGCPAWKTGL